MVFSLEESITEFSEHLSWEAILNGDLSLFTWLFYLIIIIAIYSIVVYHFYRFIARRDCFKPTKIKYSKTVGVLRYLFLYPFIAVLFFVGFSMILIFLTRTYNIDTVLYIAFAIIVAIRITAYYTEDLSKDVAKMLPFAILGIFLVDSTYFEFSNVTDRFYEIPEYVNLIIQFLILIILVEWILRVVLTIRYAIFPKKEKSATE